MKKITIEWDKNNKATIEVDGVSGPRCMEESKRLEKVLGTQVESIELKPEYFEQPHKEKGGGHRQRKHPSRQLKSKNRPPRHHGLSPNKRRKNTKRPA